MKRVGIIIVAGTVAGACLALSGCARDTAMSAASENGWGHYGSSGGEAGNAVALGALAGGESNVIIEGTIESVCPKKGCWMRVTDGEKTLFVRFQDYGFFVPMNAAGRPVVAHGTAVANTASVEELRHYAEDAGKSLEEIAKITEPETRVTFYADSVYIEGDGLDAPYGG